MIHVMLTKGKSMEMFKGPMGGGGVVGPEVGGTPTRQSINAHNRRHHRHCQRYPIDHWGRWHLIHHYFQTDTIIVGILTTKSHPLFGSLH